MKISFAVPDVAVSVVWNHLTLETEAVVLPAVAFAVWYPLAQRVELL